MKAIIEDLTKSEQVCGKTAKGLFIPASFIGMQTRTVKQFFDEHSYVDKALFDKLQIDLPLSKYFEKHPLPEETKPPVIFSTFALSHELYQHIEDSITDIVRTGKYVNLTELLPECFKKPEHTQELLDRLDQTCRLMPDQVHLCSAAFLNKCLEAFVKPSEDEAIKLIKKGQRPEKILKQQVQPKAKP